MIKTGYVLCQHCGRVFSEAYYYSGTYSVWIELKQELGGRRVVTPFTPENATRINNNKYRLTPKQNKFTQDIPHTLHVDFTDENDVFHNNVVFKRHCPFCSQNNVHEISPFFGNLPTYVIAVIGSRDIGKSTWLDSICCLANLNFRYPYKIKPHNITPSQGPRRGNTPIDDLGATAAMTICKKRTPFKQKSRDIPVANVLLLDTAGELFKEEKRAQFEQSATRQLLFGTDGFDGVDAVMFVDSTDNDGQQLAEAYNAVNELHILNDRPVAYVLNKIDRLFNAPIKVSLADSDQKVDLYTSDTFSKNASFAKCDIAPRVALETTLAAQCRTVAETIFEDNPVSAGFLIKSAQPIEGDMNDYTDSINVADPLIWVLNELDLLPVV